MITTETTTNLSVTLSHTCANGQDVNVNFTLGHLTPVNLKAVLELLDHYNKALELYESTTGIAKRSAANISRIRI